MKLFYILALGLSSLLSAQEPAAEIAPAESPEKAPEDKLADEKPPESPIKQLNDNEYLIGTVHLDKKARTISFPATVNMDDGLLEYAICHINGKLHESLLSTEIKASNLNIAFKLLRYPESDELFEIIDAENAPTGKFPDTPQATRDGARIKIDLAWEQDGKKKSASLNDLIYYITLERAMAPDPWLYTGSYMLENRYKPDLSGDIAAIFLAQPAMINFPGKDNNSDEVWIVNKKTTPPAGTPVTVTISPYEAKKGDAKAPEKAVTEKKRQINPTPKR